MVSTILLAFSKYGNKEESHKKLFHSFSDSLIKISENILNLLDDESMFMNVSLNYGSKEFLEQYLTTTRFNDFKIYKQIIDSLDKNILLSSEIISPIIDKTLIFLETNLNEVINLIKEKEMLKLNISDDIKNKLVDFFINHGDPHRTELFNLFNENNVNVSEKQLDIIVDDIMIKSDYDKLTKILDLNKYESILHKKLSEIKKLIRGSELNNQAFINLMNNLWEEKNILRFTLFDKNLLDEISKKLEALIEIDIYKSYIIILTKKEILGIAQKTTYISEYIKFLTHLHESKRGDNKTPEGKIKSNLKRQLKNFINKIKKGGVKNGSNSRRIR
jgi:hypothetical protein